MLLAVAVTVMIMVLREVSRKEVEKAEKEEAELMEVMESASDLEDN